MMNFRRGFFWRRTVDDSPLLQSESEPLMTESGREKPSGKNCRWDDTDSLQSWLVALGIFMVNFVVLGQGRVAGILYISFMKDFHVNRKMASAPYSIQQSSRMLLGPVVGIIASKFGVSLVMVLGCIIAAFSSATCYFAEDIEWIIIMWGVVYGIGSAFTSSINVALIEQYFTKYRSSASGFAFSGTCFGSIFFPTLMEILIKKYGIQGSFLIMGGIILNVIPIAMLLRERRRKSGAGGAHQSDLKSNSLSHYDASFENVPTWATGSKHEEHLRTTYGYQSFSDSEIFHLSTEENRKFSYSPREKRKASLPESLFYNARKNYPYDKSNQTFVDSSKHQEDYHPRKYSQMKSNEEIVFLKYANEKCVENSNNDK